MALDSCKNIVSGKLLKWDLEAGKCILDPAEMSFYLLRVLLFLRQSLTLWPRLA